MLKKKVYILNLFQSLIYLFFFGGSAFHALQYRVRDMLQWHVYVGANLLVGGVEFDHFLGPGLGPGYHTRLPLPMRLTGGFEGRLKDLHQRKALRFNDFSILILDEFDRMLDMGFNKEVMRIAEAIPQRQQTMLFSATLDKQQQVFIDQLLKKPVEVKVSSGETTNEHIDQEIIKVAEGENKFQVLLEMLARPDFDKVLIFAETKRWVSRVNRQLEKSGITSDEIHGNKSQNYRQRALKRFKSGQVQVLVATDVAARGLDVSDVTHVINYQMPSSLDSYIHRIGRTGRAGKTGKAYTFLN